MSVNYWIPEKHINQGLPIHFGITLYLLLDRFSAAQWVWGIVGTLYAILFLAKGYVVYHTSYSKSFKVEP